MIRHNVFSTIFLLFFSTSFSFINAQLTSLGLESVRDAVSEKQAVFDEQKSFTVNFRRIINKLSNLNYYTTRQVILDGQDFSLGKIDYQLGIDFTFKGAGSVMCPLPTVKIEVVRKKYKSFDPTKDVSLYNLGCVLVQNELVKQAHKLPGLNMFVDMKLLPIHVCMLKMILLAKTELSKSDGLYNFAQEAMRLLMRLSISKPFVDDISALLDFKKHHDDDVITSVLLSALSHLLPNDWVTVLEGLIKVVDSPAAHKVVTTTQVMLFNEKSQEDAIACRQAIVASEKEDFKDKSAQFLMEKGYETIRDYAQFVRLSRMKKNSFAQKVVFVGTIQDLPVSLRESLVEASAVPEVRTVSLGEQNMCAIICSSDDLPLRDMVCSLLAVCIKGFQEYIAVKLPLRDGMSADCIAQLERKAEERSSVIAFLDTDLGKASKQRIQKTLVQVCSKVKKHLSNAQEIDALQIQLKDLDKKIKELQLKLEQTSATVARWEQLVAISSLRGAKTFQEKLKASKEELENITAQCSFKQKEKKELQRLIDNSVILQDDTILEKKRKDLQDLVTEVKRQEASGEQVDKDLVVLIEQLQREFNELEAQGKDSLSLEKRIEARSAMSTYYRQESERVKEFFREWQQEVLREKQGVQKKVALLRIIAQKQLLDAYLQHLLAIADKINQENKLLGDLLVYQQISADDGAAILPAEEFEKIERLKLRVSNILYDEKNLGLSFQEQTSWIDMQDIMEDFFGDNPMFDKVRNILALAKDIVRQSTHIQNNFPVYELALKVLCPIFAPYFNACIA